MNTLSSPRTIDDKRCGILHRFAIDELRHMLKNFDNLTESFNQRFTLTELVTIHRCWMASEYDIAPDSWRPLQITEALRDGVVPQWKPGRGSDGWEAVYPSPRVHLAGAKL